MATCRSQLKALLGKSSCCRARRICSQSRVGHKSVPKFCLPLLVVICLCLHPLSEIPDFPSTCLHFIWPSICAFNFWVSIHLPSDNPCLFLSARSSIYASTHCISLLPWLPTCPSILSEIPASFHLTISSESFVPLTPYYFCLHPFSVQPVSSFWLSIYATTLCLTILLPSSV